MFNVCIFGGTTEARKLTSFLIEQNITCFVSVTTTYAKTLLPSSPLLTVNVKKLDKEEMVTLIHKLNPSLIIDATHPYAEEVSHNIKEVCSALQREYVTVVRDLSCLPGVSLFNTMEEMTSFLAKNTNKKDIILSTLGVKEAQALSEGLPTYQENIYLRILPSLNSLGEVIQLGYPPKHLICMQGPFSKEMNIALMHEIKATYLLTKISGKVGGFDSKREAAETCGVTLLAIKAPMREKGMSLDHVMALIQERKKREE